MPRLDKGIQGDVRVRDTELSKVPERINTISGTKLEAD